MNCRLCKGERHRDARGRFTRPSEATCAYMRTPFYKYTKARFYEEMENLMKPSIYDPPGGAAA